MELGDWVAVPGKSVIHIGEITGPYVLDPDAGEPWVDYHTVKWIRQNIPPSKFPKDISQSCGQSVIYRIRKHDAENRIRAMAVEWGAVGASNDGGSELPPRNPSDGVHDGGVDEDEAPEHNLPQNHDESQDGIPCRTASFASSSR